MDVNWREIFEKIKQYRKYILGAVFIFAILTIYSANQKKDYSVNQKEFQQTKKSISGTTKASSSSDGKVYVDIKGAVNKPGVYQLNGNLLIDDAIKTAGGITEEADLNQINLAQKLQNEMVIYVPKIGEENSPINQSNSENDQSKVNINTADAEQLQTLNGVGQKKAEMIIDYRNQNGNFKSVDDLANVKGFGPKTVENLRDQVTV